MFHVIAIIPIGFVTLWCLINFYIHWLPETGQSYSLCIILLPFIYTCRHAAPISVYIDALAGFYEAFVLYQLLHLFLHCFIKKAAYIFKADVSFQHRDKCFIDARYKAAKLDYLFSLCFSQYQQEGAVILIWIRRVVLQYFLLRLTTTPIIWFLYNDAIISILHHLSKLVAVLSLLTFLYITNGVLWIYDGVMKWLLVCAPMLLLDYQSQLFTNHIVESIAVSMEMFFISLYSVWVFPYDEESQVSFIQSETCNNPFDMEHHKK